MRGLVNLLPVLLIVGVIWLLILRPAKARSAAARALQSQIEPGTRILTTSGLYATVLGVEGDVLTLETAPGVTSQWARGAVGKVVSELEIDPELNPVLDPKPVTETSAATSAEPGGASALQPGDLPSRLNLRKPTAEDSPGDEPQRRAEDVPPL